MVSSCLFGACVCEEMRTLAVKVASPSRIGTFFSSPNCVPISEVFQRAF